MGDKTVATMYYEVCFSTYCRRPDLVSRPRVQISCPDLVSRPRVQTSCPDVPRVQTSCPSLPRVQISCPDLVSRPRVQTSCPDLVSRLRVQTLCPLTQLRRSQKLFCVHSLPLILYSLCFMVNCYCHATISVVSPCSSTVTRLRVNELRLLHSQSHSHVTLS